MNTAMVVALLFLGICTGACFILALGAAHSAGRNRPHAPIPEPEWPHQEIADQAAADLAEIELCAALPLYIKPYNHESDGL